MADEQGIIAGIRHRLAEVVAPEETQLVDDERLDVLEAESRDRKMLRRDLEDLAYTALDYFGGSEQDMTAVARRKIVQQVRVAWQRDPQIGAAADLYNDFTLGRGVPKPKARDQKVQDLIDEAWEDEDNKLVLTTYEAQMAMNTDITLQSNWFLLGFFEGDDGKVKLSVLDHDTVEQIVRDKDNRRRHLWYLTRPKLFEHDYKNHVTKAQQNLSEKDRIKYFAHWSHEAPQGQRPDAAFIGKGKVYHVAINKTGEMAFGHPVMHRVLRWSSAFNSLMEARVDMARAAAAFVMKRKVKGSRNQVEKQATQALSRRSQLARTVDIDGGEVLGGPGAASVLNENEGVEHETFSLDSKAANANTDGQMIRSQISAATHFPQHYLGDIGSANLATATSMELPVLKAIESRQEVIEGIFRWFIDLVIERAIKKGKLSKRLDDEEYAALKEDQEQEGTEEAPPTPTGAPDAPPVGAGAPTSTTEAAGELSLDTSTPGEPDEVEAELDSGENEDRVRDLSYDFSLPSPLRRMLSELITGVSEIAKTFDPNGTNMELSRTLLAIVLGEGLEMADPGEVVEKVFPPGYQDPAMAALQGAQGGPGGGQGENPFGQNGKGTDAEGNPYNAPMNGTLPEEVREARERRNRLERQMLARGGIPLEEAILDRIEHPAVRAAVRERLDRNGEVFDKSMGPLRDLAQGG